MRQEQPRGKIELDPTELREVATTANELSQRRYETSRRREATARNKLIERCASDLVPTEEELSTLLRKAASDGRTEAYISVDKTEASESDVSKRLADKIRPMLSDKFKVAPTASTHMYEWYYGVKISW